METRESKLKDFTRSREYLSLEREIIDSVQQVMSREVGNEEDMVLMVKLFDKLLAEYQVDPITREKLFWEVFCPNLKDNVFVEIAPGLIIEIKNRFGEITVFEILSKPYSKPNDEDRRKVFVKARIDGTTHEEEQNLVNWGIMPMGENFGSIAGNWKDGFIPSGTWYRKRKKQGSQ